jgi:hypothetical protein
MEVPWSVGLLDRPTGRLSRSGFTAVATNFCRDNSVHACNPNPKLIQTECGSSAARSPSIAMRQRDCDCHCHCNCNLDADSYSGYRHYLPPKDPSEPPAGGAEEVCQSNAVRTGAGGRPAAGGPGYGQESRPLIENAAAEGAGRRPRTSLRRPMLTKKSGSRRGSW